MLQYLLEFGSEQNRVEIGSELDEAAKEELKRYVPSTANDEGSYPLKSFCCDYTPRWSYIYSKSIPQLGYYRQIADLIAANKNVVFTGIRGAGKTTLLMQLVVNIETPCPKHYMLAPTLEQVESYLKSLKNGQSVLFVDDCFRDTDAIIKLLNAGNVQVICCDRDFNYERQYHKIQHLNFATKDITELTEQDAQVIINIIPMDLKRKNVSTKKFKRSGYDADLACHAFTSFSDGKQFYEAYILRDESEYIYQQAAIYFSRIGNLKEAFFGIDR